MNIFVFFLFLLVGCKSTSSPKKNLEINDITSIFQAMPKALQQRTTENGWVFFSNVFVLENFHQRLSKEFPVINSLENKKLLVGKGPLDLRLLREAQGNALSLLLAIDLEMEILSRFHSNPQSSPRCLENFWSEWGLPLPRASASPYEASVERIPSQKQNLSSSDDIPLNEKTRRIALHLRQSLQLTPTAPLKLLHFEDPDKAQFLVNNTDSYEIFAAPISCKEMAAKNHLSPAQGKLTCLQKQSATWMSMPSKDSTVLSDDWVTEVRQRCLKWVRPLSDDLRKSGFDEKLKESPIRQSWSLYPRLRAWVVQEADRYEAAFRSAIR
jgi:hypothetical protein